MPKLKKNIWADRVSRTIKSQMDLTGVNRERMESIMGCSVATFYNRMNSPETFQLGELKRLAERLKFSDEQILALFGR